MMEGSNLIFHADDYGINKEVSEHILDCHREGALNSLSVLPNGAYLEEAMKQLKPYRENIKISIHLNLAEGPCVAEPSKVPMLVDKRGMFCLSFFQVLKLSLGRKRKDLERQIYREIKAQIERMLPFTDTFRLDSHQHYHMIPVVLKSILRVLEEKKWKIEFIRIPAEPLRPFLKKPEFYHTYRPINLIKNLVLNFLYAADKKYLVSYRKKTAVFFGILLSGGMDIKRVSALLPEFEQIAERKGLPLEILAHPGGVKSVENLMDKENEGCMEFYMSKGRKEEKKMFLTIKKILQAR